MTIEAHATIITSKIRMAEDAARRALDNTGDAAALAAMRTYLRGQLTRARDYADDALRELAKFSATDFANAILDEADNGLGDADPFMPEASDDAHMRNDRQL